LNIYIPSDLNHNVNKKSLFILVRPFYSDDGWKLDQQSKRWKINEGSINLVVDEAQADIMILPYSINYYFNHGLSSYLDKYNTLCYSNNIMAYGGISGDTCRAFPEYEKIIYFRLGGFRSQLSNKNIGLPAALTDQHRTLFGSKEIIIRGKNEKPNIGFCGQANSSQIKRSKDSLMYIFENFRRFIKKPSRIDYETIFPSAYHRYLVLKYLENSNQIHTNFIYRKKYRAGAISEHELYKTTLEYYNNIRESDYILCVRGGGNYSIRLYETLLMGRIPIFINTDCILPLINEINWRDHVVWVEWSERFQIDEIVSKFHNSLSDKSFKELQLRNRQLWLEKLQPGYILSNHLKK